MYVTPKSRPDKDVKMKCPILFLYYSQITWDTIRQDLDKIRPKMLFISLEYSIFCQYICLTTEPNTLLKIYEKG